MIKSKNRHWNLSHLLEISHLDFRFIYYKKHPVINRMFFIIYLLFSILYQVSLSVSAELHPSEDPYLH